MKRWCYGILLFCLLWIPFTVNASDSGINKFYMDATILPNGDLRVKEGFDLNGKYNGFERFINYENPKSEEFNPESESYGGSSIHNGSEITLNRILGIEKIH